MVTEYQSGIPSADEVAFTEHSRASKAKKVVEVFPAIPAHATEARSLDPINGALTAASVSLTLAVRKAYRVVVSQPAHFRLTAGAGTALATDIYLPANQPVVLKMGEQWNTLSAIRAAGASDGIVQALEVS